jgi:tetratricopeptide (TPR) repeat protein
MEERQTQIREQAGLTESKLNVEFIDWLKRWSTPLMLVVLAAALGIIGYQRYQKSQAEKLDAGFRELEAASLGTGNPEALKDIADSFSSVRAVPLIARLRAADAYLRGVRLGSKVGAPIALDGKIAPEDVLTEQDRANYLNQAETLYQQVFDASVSDTAKAVHALGAAYGLAAVAESRGENDKAKSFYERAIQIADRAGFARQAGLAKNRIAQLPSLAKARFPSQSELPPVKPPKPPEAFPDEIAPEMQSSPAEE